MILQQAIDHYGVEHQLNKVDEALKELIEALEIWRKDHLGIYDLTDEISDVKIMLKQLEMILQDRHEELNIANMIMTRECFKLDRLKQRIEDDKNRHGV